MNYLLMVFRDCGKLLLDVFVDMGHLNLEIYFWLVSQLGRILA